MKFKTVPAMSGIQFSVVGFGCWGISGGDVWNNTVDEDSIKTVQKTVDLGGWGIGYSDGVSSYECCAILCVAHRCNVLG